MVLERAAVTLCSIILGVKILMVALGYLPIPPERYGGIESVIWETTIRLRERGHQVDIINANKHRVMREVLRAGKYDFVHCHHERGLSRVMLGNLDRAKVIATTHRGYFFDSLDMDAHKCLRMTARAPHIVALRQDVADNLARRNPRAKILVLPNGTDTKRFRQHDQGNGRAICLGILSQGKRPDLVEKACIEAGVPCDFVGPKKDATLANPASWLGEWTREQIYEKLAAYSLLVMLSEREGGGPPLVVAEAMAAGLSVVLSPPCSANLDVDKPFIHVTSDESASQTIRQAIAASEQFRGAARTYATQNFDWDQIAAKYEAQLTIWLGTS